MEKGLMLDEFIQSHEDWESILTGAPYNIKVSRDGCYVMLKYDQLNSDFSNPLVQAARGVIYREPEMMCVCRPFSKFFNYGESNAAKIDWESNYLSITEKIDGSLIKVWWDLGKWHVSTNGTIDAFKAPLSGVVLGSYGSLFMEAIEKNHFSFARLRQNYTHLFELVSPITRVVIRYDELNAFYLGSIETLYEWEDNLVDEMGGFPTPHRFEFHSLGEVVAEAEKMDWMHEGFVVFDGVNRIKVKSPAYVIAHYGRMNGNLSWESLVHVVISNEIEEFLSYADEWEDQIYSIVGRMIAAKEKSDIYHSLVEKHFDKNRADYAQLVKLIEAGKYADFLFKCYDYNDLTWADYTANWSASKWVKFLELKD